MSGPGGSFHPPTDAAGRSRSFDEWVAGDWPWHAKALWSLLRAAEATLDCRKEWNDAMQAHHRWEMAVYRLTGKFPKPSRGLSSDPWLAVGLMFRYGSRLRVSELVTAMAVKP